MTRQIVLDTETTGLDSKAGHRIIEMGCIELFKRRPTGKTLQFYLNPDRVVDEGALKVHGLSNEFLQDKPRFMDIADELMEFLKGAELVIHNAPFDVGFLNAELSYLRRNPYGVIEDHCEVLDTLALARQMHPGQRNSLDALCKRYQINNNHRKLHGALLDAEILAQVFLTMTGGQEKLFAEETSAQKEVTRLAAQEQKSGKTFQLRLVKANAAELLAHEAYLQKIQKS